METWIFEPILVRVLTMSMRCIFSLSLLPSFSLFLSLSVHTMYVVRVCKSMKHGLQIAKKKNKSTSEKKKTTRTNETPNCTRLITHQMRCLIWDTYEYQQILLHMLIEWQFDKQNATTSLASLQWTCIDQRTKSHIHIHTHTRSVCAERKF